MYNQSIGSKTGDASSSLPSPVGLSCTRLPLTGILLLSTLLAAPLANARPDSGQGEGDQGVEENVDQIMQREASTPPGLPNPVPRELKGRKPSRESELGDNPDSPLLSQWPPVSAPDTASGPLLPQSVGSSFLGATFGETIGYVPPDSMGAVGPSQILVIVNGRIKVFDKSGVLGALNATTDNFFASVRSASTSDPHVRYDRLSQRWFITMIDVATPNRVLIAVSSGPVITGTTSFSFFQFRHDLVGPTPNSDTGGLADYDTLGVDKNALYIGVNVFNAAGTSLIGATGFVVNKANLLAGTLTVAAFRQMGAANGTGPGIVTPQGVDNDDPNATEGYFVGPDNQFFGMLDVIRISNPGGVPNLSVSYQMTVLPTGYPIAQVQRGSSLTLDALDDRLFGAAMHRNKITGVSSLWTAHNIEVNSTGVAQTGGGRNGSRWYEIGNLTGTPTLLQSGTLFDSATTSPRGFWIPGIVASGQGHMALGCSFAGPNDSPGIAVAGRLRTDASGTTRAPTLAVVSSSIYVLSPGRWGDYSAVAVDPNDDMTFWAFEELSIPGGTWGVQAVQLRPAPPASLSTASPANITQGQSSVNVVITGTSPTGAEEFFDPGADAGGPGFANRLSASVSGGVTINSITFNNPTQVTLNLNTTSASVGAQTVTITNPDGQSSTASGILTVQSSGPDFSLSATPGSSTVTAGSPASYTVTVNASGGFTGAVGLTASGLPTGAGATFNPTSVTGSGSSSLTVTTSTTTPAGSYPITITGKSGTLTHTASVTLVVTVPDFAISATPSSQAIQAGGSTSYTTTVTASGGFGGTVSFSASGLPSGASASFSPTSVNVSGSSTLTVTTSASTPAGTYTVTITGTSGSLTHSTTVALVVNNADFSITATPTSRTVTRGSSANYTITVTPSGGFTGTVSLSASGLPSGSSYNFTPGSISTSGTSRFRIRTNGGTATGTFTLKISGTSGSIVHSATVSLTVQ
jgi:uncharacterized membrane protein